MASQRDLFLQGLTETPPPPFIPLIRWKALRVVTPRSSFGSGLDSETPDRVHIKLLSIQPAIFRQDLLLPRICFPGQGNIQPRVRN